MNTRLTLIFILFFNFLLGQCPSGMIGISGPGCGCLSGCDLTSLGGPNCNTGVAGDCTSGYQPMSTDITIPSGCDYTVTATMRPRTGCSASGADGNCNTCDRLKVDIIGGSKLWKIGGSNTTLTDSYTLTGPSIIRISGAANRADEIITYTTISTLCPNCNILLPIILIDFKVNKELDNVKIQWSTSSQIDNNYFVIERLFEDKWEDISYVSSNNENTLYRYEIIDINPPKTKLYYRLKQVDYNGNFTYSKVIVINNNKEEKQIYKIFNSIGVEVSPSYPGLKIIVYDDQTTKLKF